MEPLLAALGFDKAAQENPRTVAPQQLREEEFPLELNHERVTVVRTGAKAGNGSEAVLEVYACFLHRSVQNSRRCGRRPGR